jgi:tRNA/tmRNA/rRNA uracil-C5-methylase (TrmA/RlmC/RlmD family)
MTETVVKFTVPQRFIIEKYFCCKSGAQILGVESEGTAIDNAKHNCEQNNISNCSFYHGRAEDILPAVICKATNSNIVAIVDPPRAGLRKSTSWIFF